MGYFEEARAIWETQVPKRGQSETVAGELLRSVEKLRDEAQRNRNVNWAEGHVRMLAYLRLHLLEPGLFPIEDQATVASDLIGWPTSSTPRPATRSSTDSATAWCSGVGRIRRARLTSTTPR